MQHDDWGRLVLDLGKIVRDGYLKDATIFRMPSIVSNTLFVYNYLVKKNLIEPIESLHPDDKRVLLADAKGLGVEGDIVNLCRCAWTMRYLIENI